MTMIASTRWGKRRVLDAVLTFPSYVGGNDVGKVGGRVCVCRVDDEQAQDGEGDEVPGPTPGGVCHVEHRGQARQGSLNLGGRRCVK